MAALLGIVREPFGDDANRHMRRLGFDRPRMTREPAAVRYQAAQANDVWHFDMSPSDLKRLANPPAWVDLDRNGAPTLMLFAVVDDRSGVGPLHRRL